MKDRDKEQAQSERSVGGYSSVDAWLAAHPYGEQDENGVDISALRRNLRLTPKERLDRLESAANSMLELVASIRRKS